MTNRSFGLLEPDALLPSQFYAAFRRGSAAHGEKRLMLAVLRDAVECFQKYAFAKDGPGRQQYIEAAGWITCQDRDWYFSFENICDVLDINPDYVRSGVQEWRRRGRSGISGVAANPQPVSAELSRQYLPPPNPGEYRNSSAP